MILQGKYVCVSVFVQLLDLQLSDSNFRRYILLQYLILFHYLNAQVRFKTSVNFIFYSAVFVCFCCLIIMLNCCIFSMYTVSQIKTPMRTIVHNFVKFLPILQFFDWQTQQEICNIVIIKYPTTPQICHYTTL